MTFSRGYWATIDCGQQLLSYAIHVKFSLPLTNSVDGVKSVRRPHLLVKVD